MTFEHFRRWALDSSPGAALQREEPLDDEIKVVLAADDYDASHIIPMPPIYLKKGARVRPLAGRSPARHRREPQPSTGGFQNLGLGQQ